MPTYRIKKGKNAAWPIVSHRIGCKITTIGWRCKFLQFRYDIGEEQNQDWQKLCGVSFRLLNNHIDSAMIGCRWNAAKGKVELTSYYHIDEEIVKGPSGQDETMLDVTHDEVFNVQLLIDWENKIYTWKLWVNGEDSVQDLQEFTHDSRKYREIGFYFGDPPKAPTTLKLFKKRLTVLSRE